MAIRQTTIPRRDTGTVLERREQALEPSAMHKVLLLNNDYAPMEFTVMIPQQYFSKDRETATQIMLTVHQEGKGACGLYTRDTAATKAELASTHTRQAGYPLQCVMEGV